MARDWKDPPVVGRPCEEYLVRRLTPDECCRLQGYPDGWCKDLESEDPNEDEILFWTEVFRNGMLSMANLTKCAAEMPFSSG